MLKPKRPYLARWRHPSHALARNSINLKRIQQGLVKFKDE